MLTESQAIDALERAALATLRYRSIMKEVSAILICFLSVIVLSACGELGEPVIDFEPHGLLLGLAILDKDEEGRPVPQPAQTGILVREGNDWSYRNIEDPDSNVIHKAMVFEPTDGNAGILTLGGVRAIIKLWRKGEQPEILWEKDFGGSFSRMRDAEVADIYGDGSFAIAVATHDQGVVAVIRPDGSGGYRAEELSRQPNTIVHEIEIGDLNGDGILEIYATPSEPNRFDGTKQPGKVVRFVPAIAEGQVVVADLGNRHAKEILVGDVDGDGTDELYASVEDVIGGQVEIVRFEAGTDPHAGVTIAELPGQFCRFLTMGEVDGDGKKEIVAATYKNGLWILRMGEDALAWTVESIDKDSSGFEHAAILSDLDGDGIDELYGASDAHKQVRRYVWKGGKPVREVIYSHPDDKKVFTWNIMPVPVSLIP